MQSEETIDQPSTPGDVAADFMGDLQGEKAAQIVRRRAAAA